MAGAQAVVVPGPESAMSSSSMRQSTPVRATPSLGVLALLAASGVLLQPWLPRGLGLALTLSALLPLLHARLRQLLLLAGAAALLWSLRALARRRARRDTSR
jgi:membrane protein implicated in regulation of membrane protease activity